MNDPDDDAPDAPIDPPSPLTDSLADPLADPSADPRADPPSARARNEDVAFIRSLAEVLRDADLTGLKVERAGLKVNLARRPAPVAATASYSQPPAAYPPGPGTHASLTGPASAAASAAARGGDADEDDPTRHPGCLTSPMVGTAYIAPSPDAEPFVKPGDPVKQGQTVMIIEAMKTMNQISAPRSGTIARVLVDDGDPVEYGAPLLIIE